MKTYIITEERISEIIRLLNSHSVMGALLYQLEELISQSQKERNVTQATLSSESLEGSGYANSKGEEKQKKSATPPNNSKVNKDNLKS